MSTKLRGSVIFSSRLWIGVAVSAAWLTMMTLVGLHEHVRPGASLRRMGVSPEVLMVSWNNYDAWTWLELNKTRVGVSRLSITPVSADERSTDTLPGYTMVSQSRIKFPLGPLKLPISIYLRMNLNPEFEMRSAQGTLQALGQTWTCEGFVEGNNLYYRIAAPKDSPVLGGASGLAGGGAAGGGRAGAGAAGRIPETLPQGERIGVAPLTGPILLSDSVIPIALQSEHLKAGQHWTTPVDTPFIGAMDATLDIKVVDEEAIDFGGRQVKAWKLIERLGSTQTTAWYDSQGRMLRHDLGQGIELEQATSDAAIAFDPSLRIPPRIAPLDRKYIKEHIDPDLRGKPLKSLLPEIPGI